jgi:hypothetical protein
MTHRIGPGRDGTTVNLNLLAGPTIPLVGPVSVRVQSRTREPCWASQPSVVSGGNEGLLDASQRFGQTISRGGQHPELVYIPFRIRMTDYHIQIQWPDSANSTFCYSAMAGRAWPVRPASLWFTGDNRKDRALRASITGSAVSSAPAWWLRERSNASPAARTLRPQARGR